MEESVNNHKEELKELNSELVVFLKKTKTKVTIAIIGFILLSFSLFFDGTGVYHLDLSVMLFILIVLLLMIGLQFGFVYYIRKSPSLEIPRRKKDVTSYYKVNSVVFNVLCVLIVFVVFQMFVISNGSVNKTSMEPNYYEGDGILIYHFNVQYKRYDVVVFDVVDVNDNIMKRIIGMPGETITIKNGQVYINDVLLDDTMYQMNLNETHCSVGNDINVIEECTWIIPEDSYFVIGDNREVSIDSRDFGLVTRKQLEGKVIHRTEK